MDGNTDPKPSLFYAPQNPERLTYRQLSLRQDLVPESDVGFFGKVGRAFGGETVAGEIVRELGAPDYTRTGYVATDEDIEKYASGISPDAARRVAAATAGSSFAEFIHELDEVRLTEKRRAELFSGGTGGMLTGLGLTILAAGGEAVVLSLLATSVGAAVGGPVGLATGVGLAGQRASRLKGAITAMRTAALIDIPLETARYELDKSLRSGDLIMALGASAGLSGLIGFAKPGLYIKTLQDASDVASARLLAEVLRDSGDDISAEVVEAKLRQKVRLGLNTPDAEDVASLSRKELLKEAKARGVATHRTNKDGRKVFRPANEIREELITARTRGRVTTEMVEAQARRDVSGLSVTALRRLAKDIGANPRGKKEAIIKSIVSTRKKIAETGRVITRDVPRMPKGLNLVSSVTNAKVNVKFKGTFEKALWKLGTAKETVKSGEALIELRKIMKERGISDPDALAKKFVAAVKKMERTSRRKTVDVSKMDLPEARIKLSDGGEGVGFQPTRKVDRIEIDEDIAGGVIDEAEEALVSVNGQPIASGPREFLEDVEEMASTPTVDPGRQTITGHNEGFRETIARAIDHFPGDIPGLRLIYNFFAPITLRLLRSNSSEVRLFVTEFLENPRGGASNVTTRARIAVERHYGKLRQEVNAARETARQSGQTLDDLTILRAVRSGEEFDGPLGQAVNAVRKFHRDVKAYGAKRGLDLGTIPDDPRYFNRAYSHTQFLKLIDELGEENVLELLTQAIRRQVNADDLGVTEEKARAAARRILEYGKDPRGTRNYKDTQVVLDRVRRELISDGIPEEEVEDFMELIIPRLEHQPHLSYARRRIGMDENFSMVIGGRTVHVDELFNNNMSVLTARYAQRVIGGAEVRVGLKNAFGNADMSFQDLVDRVTTGAREAGEDADFVEKVVTKAYRGMVGQPIFSDSSSMKWIMGTNAFAQATIGMTLGFAQIPEIASIIFRTGLKASFQQLPQLREIATIFTMGIRDLATGRQGLGLEGLRKMQDDLASVLETFTGVAGDYRRGDHFMRRLDDMGFDSDYIGGGAMKYLEWGRQVSMLNPLGIMSMDTFLRRWAVRSSFQHFVNQAYEIGPDGVAVLNKSFWDNSKVRFAQLGLSEEDITKISKILRNPDIVKTRKSMFGTHKVRDVDLEKFAAEDLAVFDKFAFALRRHCDHMVQRQSFGESPYWVSTPVGKLLGQYRVFMLASKSKQLAAGVARGDVREGMNIVGSMGLGALAYYLQTHYRAASMDDATREKYLKEKLDSDKMMRAGVMKSSYPSIFPMLIDSFTAMVGEEPVFDPSMRTTGLGINPVTGSVPYGVMTKFEKSVREVTGAAFRDDTFSKKDWRDTNSLFWFTKVPGAEQLINRLWINNLNAPQKD